MDARFADAVGAIQHLATAGLELFGDSQNCVLFTVPLLAFSCAPASAFLTNQQFCKISFGRRVRGMLAFYDPVAGRAKTFNVHRFGDIA